MSATAANDNINPGWNFTGVWYMTNGVTYPMLLAFKPAAVMDSIAPTTHEGSVFRAGE